MANAMAHSIAFSPSFVAFCGMLLLQKINTSYQMRVVNVRGSAVGCRADVRAGLGEGGAQTILRGVS